MMRIKNCFSVVAAFRLLRMSFSIGSVCSMWKSGWIKRKGNRKEKKSRAAIVVHVLKGFTGRKIRDIMEFKHIQSTVASFLNGES